jgi:hypothetical protein
MSSGIDPPQFVAIDLQEKKITKAWPFPKDINQGFGFNATYKVSGDGKRLYVFQEDILVFDLETFKQGRQNRAGSAAVPRRKPISAGGQ